MKKQQIFWEKVAKFYTPIQEKSNQKLYQTVSKKCLPYCKNQHVLEIGCGTGQLTLPLYPHAKKWEATDFSPNMIAVLQKRCADVPSSVQDVTALPYKDNSFSTVLIANVLHIIENPKKALTEIRRVLCDGGILLAPTFIYEGKINRFRMWLTTKLGFHTYHKWTLAELSAFLEKAGFSVIETSFIKGNPLPEGFIAAKKQ